MGLPTITTSSAGATATAANVHGNDKAIADELGNLEKSTNITTYKSAWVVSDSFLHVPRFIVDAPERGMGSIAAGWNQAANSPLRGIYEVGQLFEVWPQTVQLTRIGAFIRTASGSHIARDIPAASGTGSPTTINYTAHGLKTGQGVIISGYDNGNVSESNAVNVAAGHKITLVNTNSFTIPVATTGVSTAHGQFVQMRTSNWYMHKEFKTTFTLRISAYSNTTDKTWEASAISNQQEVGKLILSAAGDGSLAQYSPLAVLGTAAETWRYNDSTAVTAAAGQAYFKDFPSGTSGDSSNPRGTITFTAASTRTFVQFLLQSSTVGLTPIRVRDTGSLTRIFLSSATVSGATLTNGGVTVLQVGDHILFAAFDNGVTFESDVINDSGGWRVEGIGSASISGGTYNGQTKPYVEIHDIGATLADLAGGCLMRPKHMAPVDFAYEARFEEDHVQPGTGYPST
jgi:hypothetical protein